MACRIALLLLGGVVASQAFAQVSYPPASVTPDDLQNAITAATPDTCGVPMSDTLRGSAGNGPRCMPRNDASRPTVVQAKTTLTGADSLYSVTFDAPFASTPIYADARVYGASMPYLCTVETLTTTTATGRCYQLVATTLPATVTALVGLTISPFQAAGGNLSVRVVARQ